MILLEGVAPSSDSIDYSDGPLPSGTVTIGPVKIISVKKASAPGKTTKTPVKRTGKTAPILDALLPLKQDLGTGQQTIFGLPPFLVYLIGGVGASFAGFYLMRKVAGGGGRRRRMAASNPKRRPKKTRRRRAQR